MFLEAKFPQQLTFFFSSFRVFLDYLLCYIPEIFSCKRKDLGLSLIHISEPTLSLIHISEPTRHLLQSRMPSSA